jgi:hypothetical protein
MAAVAAASTETGESRCQLPAFKGVSLVREDRRKEFRPGLSTIDGNPHSVGQHAVMLLAD